MFKLFIPLLCILLDSGVDEKLVVIDHVDMVEVNHKFYQSNTPPEIKRQFIQVIFWEYRENILLPEYKDGKQTGYWKQGSDYVVIDYFTLDNRNYGLDNKNGMSPYLYKGKWYTHYYDSENHCQRTVIAKQIRITHTLFDPEHTNTKIVETASRKGLTKPDRYDRIIRVSQEVEDLLDRNTTP